MPQESWLSLSWVSTMLLGFLMMCVIKDSLIMTFVMVEVMTALIIGCSCIFGASAVLLVGGVLVCGSSLMLAGLIMSL